MCKQKIIIIGGGIGGLFAGAFLAKEGCTVTIIEKNATIGGGLQSFRRFGALFDTGMHVIGGMGVGQNMHKICNYLRLLDKIDLRAVDADCTDEIYVAADNATYRIAKGRDGFVDSLSTYFPHERRGLEAYVDAMTAIAREVDMFNLKVPEAPSSERMADFFMPADAFIAKYIGDARLRTVLSFQNIFYAGEGGVTPAFIHSIISVLYMSGPLRFVGGACKFAEALADIITQHGGTIIKGEAVTAVGVVNRRITGCTTATGRTLTADTYISAIHPSAFVDLLDDVHALPHAFRERLTSTPNTYSAFILSIKLKPGTMEFFNHMGHYLSNADDVWRNPADATTWPNLCLYMTPPADSASPYATTMKIIAPMAWSEVEKWQHTISGQRGTDYTEWKHAKAEAVVGCIERVLPQLPQCIDKIDISTPLTIRDYYGVKHGALYGYRKDCNSILLSKVPVRSKICNLFMTGQNNNLHGFCGVALTAIETCDAILGSTTVLDKINSFDNNKH